MKKNWVKVIAVVMALVMCIAVTAFAGVTVSITRNIGTIDSLEKVRDFTVKFDSSYPTGGEILLVSDLALTTLHSFSCEKSTAGYAVAYDHVSRIIMYDVSAAFEVYNTKDVSNVTINCRATGK